ncbi:hypothetical protein M7I_1888 [Glarea lozoyensis 74030]|uniref:Heterokaryon incompatibility domain-containing protein n=1 Tax=Glarea lozoyensis (strain ATCC 74030 / MF5533) TaxID=1104152 RepID=H0EHB1_GLAL7|nr:hypothetical protein M7I_1888 [Glarea lozoyensis 74030]
MRLVPVLHERYLWVDSLCVLQDDENKHLELLNMTRSYIYTNGTAVVWQSKPPQHLENQRMDVTRGNIL